MENPTPIYFWRSMENPKIFLIFWENPNYFGYPRKSKNYFGFSWKIQYILDIHRKSRMLLGSPHGKTTTLLRHFIRK